MRKTITTKFLKSKGACQEGIDLVATYKNKETIAVIKQLIEDGKPDWANWLIVRVMTYEQYVSYACYAARQVLPIYEKKFPDDKRPREAIEAAEKCIKSPTRKNKDVAKTAAYAARAARAAHTAYAYAANAAYAALAAADAAYAASAYRAALAARAAYRFKSQKKILNYGIKLLKNSPKSKGVNKK